MVAMFCYFKGCSKCGGDLIFDDDDWKCWQCGQYYYMTPATPSGQPHLEPLNRPTSQEIPESEPRKGPRAAYGARSARNINAAIRARETGDERWWTRNRKIVKYLDGGLPVKEIAKLVGRGERQIRVVRERLADLRAQGAEGTTGSA